MPTAVVSTGAAAGQASGIPEAPTDGQLYERQGSTASWVAAPPVNNASFVQKAGDTMTGTLIIGNNSELQLVRVAGAEVHIKPNSSDYGIQITDTETPSFPVSIKQGYIIVADLSGASGEYHCDHLLWTQPNVAIVTLKLDPATSDLIATASYGPNAGKKVNLTAGKWA